MNLHSHVLLIVLKISHESLFCSHFPVCSQGKRITYLNVSFTLSLTDNLDFYKPQSSHKPAYPNYQLRSTSRKMSAENIKGGLKKTLVLILIQRYWKWKYISAQ